MTCRTQAAPVKASDQKPYVSGYIRDALERCKLIGKPVDHGALCPCCWRDADEGWDRWNGRCECGHVAGPLGEGEAA